MNDKVIKMARKLCAESKRWGRPSEAAILAGN